MGDNLTTTATTREATVTAQPDVVYHFDGKQDGGNYTVVPHPPTPRDDS